MRHIFISFQCPKIHRCAPVVPCSKLVTSVSEMDKQCELQASSSSRFCLILNHYQSVALVISVEHSTITKALLHWLCLRNTQPLPTWIKRFLLPPPPALSWRLISIVSCGTRGLKTGITRSIKGSCDTNRNLRDPTKALVGSQNFKLCDRLQNKNSEPKARLWLQKK